MEKDISIIIYDLREEEYTYMEISKKLGLDYQKVKKLYNDYCTKNNLPIKKECRGKLYSSTEEIFQLRQQGVSLEELAKKYNCSVYGVRNAYERYCAKNNIDPFATLKEKEEIKLNRIVINCFYKNKMSEKDISKVFKVTEESIKELLIATNEEIANHIDETCGFFSPVLKQKMKNDYINDIVSGKGSNFIKNKCLVKK